MFENLRIGTRLILAFLVMSILVAAVSIFSVIELNKVQGPLTKDIPAGLLELETTSHLDGLAQKIRFYDQVLTESARNYAQSGDKKWKYRYKNVEPQLSSAIREAIEKGDAEDQQIFSAIQKAKLSYADLEYQCLASVDIGDRQRALAILESQDYWQHKEEYKAGLESYIERRGKKYGDTLEVTATKVDQIVQDTHRLVSESLQFLTIFSLLSMLLAVVLGIFVSRSILNPMKSLERGVEIIGKGNLDYKIRVKAKDEMGRFATAFNDMTRKLKESYAGLEQKVREKTSELANKVEELEETKKTILKEKVVSEALLASIGEGMIATDQNGSIMVMNPQAEAMFGWTADEALGQSFWDVIPSQSEKGEVILQDQRAISMALATGKKVISTAYYISRDKRKIPVAITVSPVRLDDKILGAIEIVRDITKEKEVDMMKTEFISTVSHELRTPLTVIREGVSLVLDQVFGQINEKQKKFLWIALEDIDRLKRIIDNLLDISKIESGKIEIKREEVDLVHIAQSVLATFQTRAHNKGLELRVKSSSEKIEAYLDRDKIIQVFTNLIGNAMKFTEKGHIEVGVEEKGGEIQCYVADSGKGIAEEDLAKMFGKFQQVGRTNGTGEKGTGLGLSISKGIVGLHRGKIWVESKLDQGTRFVFLLPKFTFQDQLRDTLMVGMKEAKSQKSALSLVTFEFKNIEMLRNAKGRQKTVQMMTQMEAVTRNCLRRQLDMTLWNRDTLHVILPTTIKENAFHVADRVHKSLVEYLSKEDPAQQIKLYYKIVAYPEDGSSENDLIQHSQAA